MRADALYRKVGVRTHRDGAQSRPRQGGCDIGIVRRAMRDRARAQAGIERVNQAGGTRVAAMHSATIPVGTRGQTLHWRRRFEFLRPVPRLPRAIPSWMFQGFVAIVAGQRLYNLAS